MRTLVGVGKQQDLLSRRRVFERDAAGIGIGRIDDQALHSKGLQCIVVEGQQRRMKSTRALKQELRLKGVDAEVVDEALAETADDADYQAASALARKKVRTMGALEPHVRYRRLAGALARRGFAPGLCHRVVSEVTEGVDDEGDRERP